MNWVTEANGLVDAIRVLTVFVGSSVAVYVLWLLRNWRSSDMDLARKLRYLALFAYGVLTAVQEAQQIGEPLLVWRLPLLFLASVTALIGLTLPGIQCYWKRRTFKPITHFEWPDEKRHNP